MNNGDFYNEWRKFQGSEVEYKDQQPICPVAAEFLGKLHDMIFVPLGEKPTRGQITQAKYMLQEEWQTWKKSMPSLHLRSSNDHHQCLNDAYDTSYDRLHLLDLTRRPTLNVIADHEEMTKQPPPAPIINLKRIVQPQLGSIAIGEKLENVERGVDSDAELIREIEELAEVESIEGIGSLTQIADDEKGVD